MEFSESIQVSGVLFAGGSCADLSLGLSLSISLCRPPVSFLSCIALGVVHIEICLQIYLMYQPSCLYLSVSVYLCSCVCLSISLLIYITDARVSCTESLPGDISEHLCATTFLKDRFLSFESAVSFATCPTETSAVCTPDTRGCILRCGDGQSQLSSVVHAIDIQEKGSFCCVKKNNFCIPVLHHAWREKGEPIL